MNQTRHINPSTVVVLHLAGEPGLDDLCGAFQRSTMFMVLSESKWWCFAISDILSGRAWTAKTREKFYIEKPNSVDAVEFLIGNEPQTTKSVHFLETAPLLLTLNSKDV